MTVWHPCSSVNRLLIFNSHFTKTKFESFHGEDFPSVVVPLTADALGSPSENNWTTSGDQPRQPWMLTVGRMEPDRPKGHREILRAMPEIVSLHTTNGTWDLIARVETTSLPEFDRVLREVREIRGVLNSETCLLLDTAKG